MRLLVLENDTLLGEVVCGREDVYIGSQEGCRVVLPDVRISPQQAVLRPIDDDRWEVTPLDSSPTLSLNGEHVSTSAPLRLGDEIRIADFLIRVYPDTGDATAAVAAPMRSEGATSVAQLLRFAQSTLPPGSLLKKPEEPITVAQSYIGRIGQINVALAPCMTPQELMNVALAAVMQHFFAQKAWIGVRRVNYGSMEYIEGRTPGGQTAELPEYGDRLKPRVLDRGQFVLVPQWSAEERVSIMIGPLAGPDAILGMIYLERESASRRFEPQEFDFFVLMLNLFAVQLDAIFKDQAHMRAALIDGEVAVAHEIQARLTPRKLPQWETLQFGAFREPGRERTGDIYDVLKMSNNTAALMVAQTSATGPMPSMLMSQTHAAFRINVMHQAAPNVSLRALNWLLHDGQKDRLVDCFVAFIDPPTGQVRYAKAGGIGAFIIDQRGEERRLGGADETQPSLGLMKGAQYPLLSEQIEPDETLVVFTSGVTTAKNRKGEIFGQERFVSILCDGFGQLASQLLKDMLNDLRAFTEGGLQPDDITVLMAHRV